ncbi:MAG: hypothetical protein FJY77_01825 [Candidatus Altiarchaeales archaeon]|nr:hypothetical protein [Candidatus Altiarchaeales archaeon]
MIIGHKRNCVFAVLAVLLACMLLFPFNVRVFVDIFAIGLSDIKILAFPVFACLLALLYYHKPNELDYCQTARRIWMLLAVLFTAGILSFIYLVLVSGVDGFYRFYVVRDGFISSNLIGHIHASKPIIGWPLEFFPQFSYTLDFGYPIMAYIPFYVYIPFTLMLFCLLYLLYKIVPNLAVRLNYSVSLFFIFAIGLFTVLKNIVDGGLLNTQLTIPLAVFTFLFAFRKEDSFACKTARLLGFIAFFALLQFCMQAFLTAWFSRSFTYYVISNVFNSMVSDGNIYASLGLLLVAWVSFSLLDRRQSVLRLIACMLVFIVLFTSLTLTLSQMDFSDNPVEYSLALLNAVRKSYDINSSISFLARKELNSESIFFVQTNFHPLRQHKIVWGYNTKTVSIPELYPVSGTPPSRRNERMGCNPTPLEQKETLLFKIFGFNGNVMQANNSLLSIGHSERREGEYQLYLNYCVPSKHVVLMETLSMQDSVFVLELVTSSRQHEEL